MKNIGLLVVWVLLLIGANAVAQFEEGTSEELQEMKFHERLSYGGNLGLNFGNITLINVTPSVGYRFTPKFTSGLTATYQFLRNNLIGFQTSMYGGGPFARYRFFRGWFAHAQYEILNLEAPKSQISNEWERTNVHIPLVGLGVMQLLGSGVYLQILALYDVNDDWRSPYVPFMGLPIIVRGGISIGL